MDNDSFGDLAGHGRPPRDAIKQAVPSAPAPVRTVELVTGDFLLTVNPVDGSEIELCPPVRTPARPVRHTAAERAEVTRAALPPVPAGPAAPRLPLLERDEPRERLVRLLGQGRSVRLTGAAGSGRTVLLDAVAEECAAVAPDGVVRLNGLHRTPGELLQELFAAVYSAPGQRPDRNALAGFVRDIGAVVVLDDLEFGGAALDELLDAAPECAFLLAATPEVAAPSADSPLEEVFLGGLGRATALDLLRQVVGRVLTEEEANWAGDLWFESEGLPLRFVQAGALLRQCDDLRGDPEAFEEFAPFDAVQGRDVPLPSLGEGGARAAARLPADRVRPRHPAPRRRARRRGAAPGPSARPHRRHPRGRGGRRAHVLRPALARRPALPPRRRSARPAPGEGLRRGRRGPRPHGGPALHLVGRPPSVTPERAASEADALLASLAALVPAGDAGYAGTAVLLARSAAPAFAAGRHWGAWERTLRVGSQAARIAGEVAEDAYFHHELGVLALCTGNLDRARAELEASIAMRGALADRNGTVAGRRTLALVEDRTQGLAPNPETPTPRPEGPHSPPRGVPLALPSAGAATARLPLTGAEDASPATRALPVPRRTGRPSGASASSSAPGATWSPSAPAPSWRSSSARSSPWGRPRGRRNRPRRASGTASRPTAARTTTGARTSPSRPTSPPAPRTGRPPRSPRPRRRAPRARRPGPDLRGAHALHGLAPPGQPDADVPAAHLEAHAEAHPLGDPDDAVAVPVGEQPHAAAVAEPLQQRELRRGLAVLPAPAVLNAHDRAAGDGRAVVCPPRRARCLPEVRTGGACRPRCRAGRRSRAPHSRCRGPWPARAPAA
ncbi:ATP-binding protein [Streptomyces zhihengii]